MTRSRASAKNAGAMFSRSIADYLRDTVDFRIDVRHTNGRNDRGDVGGVYLSPALGGGGVVIENKNERNEVACPGCGRKSTSLSLGSWQREAEIERGNADAIASMVVHKRHGTGAPGRQWATMEVDDVVALLTGSRPAGGAL